MKARFFTLILLITLSYSNLSAQFWRSLTDKKGRWGINKIQPRFGLITNLLKNKFFIINLISEDFIIF